MDKKKMSMEDILKLSESQRLDLANSQIEYTNIKGKQYAAVNERIRVFRKYFPGFMINTEIERYAEKGIIQFDGKDKVKPASIIFRVDIRDADNRLRATGTAMEKESGSGVNSTSFVENGETSAVGRALGIFGIGVKESIASYDEVMESIKNQSK